MSAQSSKRAAIYARISADRAGAGLGVDRQRQDCQALADKMGWDVVGVYQDNDISAYTGKPRPSYSAMLDAIASAQIDVVLAWHTDRLHRSPLELEHFIALVEKHGTTVKTVTAGELDLATPTGRMAARIFGAVARQESEHKSERIKRKAEQNALAGRRSGGGHRPFGYDFVNGFDLKINQREAKAIQYAKDRVLAGVPLGRVCGDLEAQDIKTARGNSRWSRNSLRGILCGGLISGQREYQPKAKGVKRQQVGPIVANGTWPAIIKPEETEALRTLLLDPSRYRPNTGRVYLLSGIARCSLCGGSMIGKTDGTNRTPRYGCSQCRKTYIQTKWVDFFVVDALREHLAKPEVWVENTDETAALDDQLSDALAAETELAKAFGEGAITNAEWKAARMAVQKRIAEHKSRLAEARGDMYHAKTTGAPLMDRWEQLDLDERRALIATYIESVTVLPARRGFNGGSDYRLAPEQITWV